jgi:hypothetical protein
LRYLPNCEKVFESIFVIRLTPLDNDMARTCTGCPRLWEVCRPPVGEREEREREREKDRGTYVVCRCDRRNSCLNKRKDTAGAAAVTIEAGTRQPTVLLSVCSRYAVRHRYIANPLTAAILDLGRLATDCSDHSPSWALRRI